MSNSKWIYNISRNDERWDCEEEFDTKEEAITAGLSFFTDANGYKEYYEEEFEGDKFQIGRKESPTPHICSWRVVEDACEDVYELCGEVSEHWLVNLTSEEEDRLTSKLTEAFKEWLKETGNEPKFYAVEDVETVWIKNCK